MRKPDDPPKQANALVLFAAPAISRTRKSFQR